jgi:hypothetical protein
MGREILLKNRYTISTCVDSGQLGRWLREEGVSELRTMYVKIVQINPILRFFVVEELEGH